MRSLGRAHIVITSRPIPFDEQLLRRLMPAPPTASAEPREQTFARIATGDHPTPHPEDEDDIAAQDWRTAGLMLLSDGQIVEFAMNLGVEVPESLLNDLEKRNAQELTRRPQDLIELFADWREHTRIRTHRDQVATNVRVKLQPREDRLEPAAGLPSKICRYAQIGSAGTRPFRPVCPRWRWRRARTGGWYMMLPRTTTVVPGGSRVW